MSTMGLLLLLHSMQQLSKQSLEYLHGLDNKDEFFMKPLKFPNQTTSRPGNFAITTIKHLMAEKENETETRYKDQKALIVYEETDDQRPSSPFPRRIIEILASKQELVIIHVKHGFEPKFFKHEVVIFFQKDHKDKLEIAINGTKTF